MLQLQKGKVKMKKGKSGGKGLLSTSVKKSSSSGPTSEKDRKVTFRIVGLNDGTTLFEVVQAFIQVRA
jgi:hypothetical protein